MQALFADGRTKIWRIPVKSLEFVVFCVEAIGSLDASMKDGSVAASLDVSLGRETKWRISPADVPT